MWFSRMETREDALKIVKGCSTVFFVVAGLQTAWSLVHGFVLLYDVAIYVVAAFMLNRFKSRAAAIVLLIMAIVATTTTVANLAGKSLGGGSNVLVAVVVLWSAIRAVGATFKLRSRFSDMPSAVLPHLMK